MKHGQCLLNLPCVCVCVCVCLCVCLCLCIQDAGAHPLCSKHQLKDLLLCEISRLSKYPLLIDYLLKHTQRK